MAAVSILIVATLASTNQPWLDPPSAAPAPGSPGRAYLQRALHSTPRAAEASSQTWSRNSAFTIAPIVEFRLLEFRLMARQPTEPTSFEMLAPDLQLDGVDRTPTWLNISGRVAAVLTGAWASALTHEAGHALMAWGHGRRFQWPTTVRGTDPFLPLWRVSDDVGPRERRNIAMGGFLLSIGLEELIIHTDLFPKSDAFVGGFLFYSVLNSVVYTARDIISVSRGDGGVGDIRDMANGGIPRPVIYIVLLAHSAWSLANFLEDPDFVSGNYWTRALYPVDAADIEIE